jgi:hypothetical protein
VLFQYLEIFMPMLKVTEVGLGQALGTVVTGARLSVERMQEVWEVITQELQTQMMVTMASVVAAAVAVVLEPTATMTQVTLVALVLQQVEPVVAVVVFIQAMAHIMGMVVEALVEVMVLAVHMDKEHSMVPVVGPDPAAQVVAVEM